MSPNVSHWANNTHRRHTAGFNTACHGAPCTNVFCRGVCQNVKNLRFAPPSVFFALMKGGLDTNNFYNNQRLTNLFLHFIRKRGYGTKTLRYY